MILWMGVAFSILYFVSFVAKAVSVSAFRRSIIEFDVIHKRLAAYAAALVLFLEMALALMFGLQILLRSAFAVSALLMLFFSFLLAKAKYENKKVKCNCFGTSDKVTNLTWSLIRNGIILLMSIAGFAHSDNSMTIATGMENNLMAAACIGLSYITVKKIWSMYEKPKNRMLPSKNRMEEWS